MKPNLFIKSLLLMLFAALMTIDVHAQNIQVYRDGVLIATYDESNVDEVTFSANSVVFKRGESTVVYSGADLDKITFKETNAPHEYVDLGLPSGTLWATCNVGADAPEDYGGYYAWGETETKSVYGWSTYTLCDGTYKTINKYCTDSYYGIVDNKLVLEADDDVAHVLWGDNWYIPSKEEWAELHSYCTWQSTTINNVKGTKVIGPNGNSIFLPKGGDLSNNKTVDLGIRGRYWSSDLAFDRTNYPRYAPREAFCYQLYYGNDIIESERGRGLNVRPVYRDKVKTFTKELEVLPAAVAISGEIPNDRRIDIKCNSFWTIQNISDNWLYCNIYYGAGDGFITIGGYPNPGKKPRTAKITVKCGDITREIIVTQDIKHEYVDLGLSVKWASYNIGATKPGESGNYYAWGELETKESYDWTNYKWGTQKNITKYCDNKTYGKVDRINVLEPDDDVAHIVWGGNWRMPTAKEFDELIQNCTWRWTWTGGLYGYEVTSNKPGYTDKSIFLPASGIIEGSDKHDEDIDGYYWTSELNAWMTPSISQVMWIGSGNHKILETGRERCCGLPIRPVYQEQE